MTVKFTDLPTLKFLTGSDITSDENGNAIWWNNGMIPETMTDALTQLSDALVNYIYEWDKQNVQELFNNISDLKTVCDAMNIKYDQMIKLSDLPSEPILMSIATYPVWAIDKSGRCLVGDAADGMEYLSDILEKEL